MQKLQAALVGVFIGLSNLCLAIDIPKENRNKLPLSTIEPFDARAKDIVAAIKKNRSDEVLVYFFPEKAFESLKDIKWPSVYYKKLIKWYKADISREQERFKGKTLEFKTVKMGRCKWKEKGSEYNKIPYWSCYRNKILVSSEGKEATIDLGTVINWGTQWYVTHLGPIPKE